MSLWRQVCRLVSQSERLAQQRQLHCLPSLTAWHSPPASDQCCSAPDGRQLQAWEGRGQTAASASSSGGGWQGLAGGCGRGGGRACGGGWGPGQRRRFSVEVEEEPREVDMQNPKLVKLRDQILELNMLEVADLTTILCARLGINEKELLGGGGGGYAPAPPPTAAPAAEAPKAEEKTDFDVKLTGFEAASKVKVIKEVRSVLPELGLKEAKEMVEKAPCMIKAGLKKEDAEALKEKLEKVGGKVVLE